MNNKKAIKNTFIALLISVVTLLVIFSFLGFKNLTNFLSGKYIYILFLSFFLFFMVMIIDSFRTILVSRALGYKLSFFTALRNSILFYFISDITPLSAGGQPYQVYHYSKYGLSGSDSTNIVVSRFVEYIFTSTFIGFVGYIYLHASGFISFSNRTSYLFLLAFTVSAASGVFILISMVYPQFLIHLTKLANLKPIAFLMKRLGLNEEKLRKKLDDWVKKFDVSIKRLWKKNFYIMLIDIFLGLMDIFFQVMSLYIIFKYFGIHSNFLDIFGVFVLLNLIVYYVPTPGASGGLESVYFLVFSSLLNIKNDNVMLSITIWRIATFYFIIFIGFVIFLIENKLKGEGRNEKDSGTDSNLQ